jgi:hypothetical protein
MYNRLYLTAKWICSTCWSICGFDFAQRPCRAVRDCISAVVIEVATRSWYTMMMVKLVGGQRSEEDKMKGADDVARTGAFPLQRCRRVATSRAAKIGGTRCGSRLRYRISTLLRVSACQFALLLQLTMYRAHGIAQLARSDCVGETQRRADMLHRHTGPGHASVGVSWRHALYICSI